MRARSTRFLTKPFCALDAVRAHTSLVANHGAHSGLGHERRNVTENDAGARRSARLGEYGVLVALVEGGVKCDCRTMRHRNARNRPVFRFANAQRAHAAQAYVKNDTRVDDARQKSSFCQTAVRVRRPLDFAAAAAGFAAAAAVDSAAVLGGGGGPFCALHRPYRGAVCACRHAAQRHTLSVVLRARVRVR